LRVIAANRQIFFRLLISCILGMQYAWISIKITSWGRPLKSKSNTRACLSIPFSIHFPDIPHPYYLTGSLQNLNMKLSEFAHEYKSIELKELCIWTDVVTLNQIMQYSQHSPMREKRVQVIIYKEINSLYSIMPIGIRIAIYIYT